MGFIETFIDTFNAGFAFILIILIGQMLLIMRKVDRDLLKARLFLNDAVMQRTWIFISVSGAAFALNALIKFIIRFTDSGKNLNITYLGDLTQLIFLMSFIFAVYNWYTFIGSSANQKYNLR